MDLICSDLHANLYAMRVLRKYIKAHKPERLFILGDIVGYGAHPNEVVQMVKTFMDEIPTYVIHGNHDYAVMNPEFMQEFNHRAMQAAVWTMNTLTPENIQFIDSLKPDMVLDDIECVHGSPTGFNDYILTRWDSMAAFNAMKTHLCFFGHTHLPCIISGEMDDLGMYVTDVSESYTSGKWIQLNASNKTLINPGSVGQPRDRNPKLSFCLFDPIVYAVKHVRLTYDWDAAKAAIDKVTDLHPSLGLRLLEGW